ncbi:MAG: BtrH N-terminal domain-containing protein [Bacteroidetes bacterium]|nr:BtrH N-terminal domain-containing protein [Bacteroidota bacterium]
MSDIQFNHKMAAHCESGTVTALLNHGGFEITEPMVFGMASGIFFAYFHKMSNFTFPTFVVRNKPGQMRTNIEKRTGAKFKTASYKDPIKAEKALDDLLEQNIPVAVQVDFFYMDYLPAWFRVHNNVHFITIVGKKDSKYLVSDCYFPKIAEIDAESLRKGRSAGGEMAPNGFLFYLKSIPKKEDINFEKEIKKGIKRAGYYMLKIPIPFLGIKGILKFADKIEEWPKFARDTEHLSHEIMKINVLLEDQGTGGAGFRFMYATFLRQASELLNDAKLLEMSKKMMEIGDGWRSISVFAARIGKNRDLGPERLKELSEMIRERAQVEKVFFTELYQLVK